MWRLERVICVVVLMLVGCQRGDEIGTSQDAGDSATVAGEAVGVEASDARGSKDASEADVTVKLAGYSEVMKFISEQTGAVVVLDVWSTSCVPCMQEFPHLVELSRQYNEKVVCVSLNVDFIGLKKKPAESYIARAEEFLVSKRATLTNFLSSDADDIIREKLEITSIPAILIFDQQGQIVHRLTEAEASGDSLSYKADVVPAIDALLNAAL